MALTSVIGDRQITAYIRALAREPYTIQTRIRERVAAYESEPLHISPEQGAFLSVVVRLRAPQRILEFGTHWGYSTLWLASGLSHGGTIDTIEQDPFRAEQARDALREAGVLSKVKIHIGRIEDVVSTLAESSIDLIFIDGENVDYLVYLGYCERLLARRGVIVADNTLHKGRVANPNCSNSTIGVLNQFNQALTSDAAWTASIVPIGDGMTVAIRNN